MTRTPAPARDRYWLCGDDCTTDCGICKGAGRTPAPALTAVLDELDELRAAIGDSPAFRVTGLAVDDEEPEWVRALFDDGGASLFAECYGADAARLIVAAVNRLPELTAALRAVLELADDLTSYVAARGLPAPGTYDDGVNRAQSAVAADLRAAITTALEAS